MLILVLYVSFQFGSLNGVILGFSLGLLEDLISSGSLMGLSSLTKSISPLNLTESEILEAQKNRFSETNLKENLRH